MELPILHHLILRSSSGAGDAWSPWGHLMELWYHTGRSPRGAAHDLRVVIAKHSHKAVDSRLHDLLPVSLAEL